MDVVLHDPIVLAPAAEPDAIRANVSNLAFFHRTVARPSGRHDGWHRDRGGCPESRRFALRRNPSRLRVMNPSSPSQRSPADPPRGPATLEIEADQAEESEAILADLVDEVRLDFAALLDDSGTVLGWAGGQKVETVEGLIESSGALAMGTFAASQALALQLGGDDSRELLHHAGSRSFHLV